MTILFYKAFSQQHFTAAIFTVLILHILWFQKHLKPTSMFKQLWPPDADGCRRTEGQLSTLAAKGCVLSTQQERSFKWIDTSEWWWREEWWTSRESLWLPAIGTWRYPIRAYKWLGAMIVMFPICMAPWPHSSISEEFLHCNYSQA